MKKIAAILAGLGLFACGGDKDLKADSREGCEPESAERVCESAGASCGEILGKNRCGEAVSIDCGSCAQGRVCEDHVCVAADESQVEVGGCLLVPAGGVCASHRSINRCMEVGADRFKVVLEDCLPGELCRQGEAGADCHPMESCEGTLSFCTAEGNVKSCKDGVQEEIECETGCSTLRDGSSCRKSLPGTVLHKGKVFYEHRRPNGSFTGWDDPVLLPAAGLSVFSLTNGLVLDGSIVEPDGSFEVLVFEDPGEGDSISFGAFANLMGRGTTLVAVVNPDLQPGMHQLGTGGPNLTLWTWHIEDTKREEFIIQEKDGAGAIQIFRGLLGAVSRDATLFGLGARNLAAWFQPGVDWVCGACYVEGSDSSTIYYSGGEMPANRSDAVILHEAGHNSFTLLGPPVAEGGGHCVGVPSPPSQALSEGHASWYSADLRRNGRLYAAYRGTFSYWDISSRDSMWKAPEVFAPPNPGEGPDQDLNETWVAAVLWDLAKNNGRSLPIHEALRASEMSQPLSSGYHGKIWMSIDAQCRPIDPRDTGKASPILSDLLDALVCNGFPTSHVEEIISPWYPYDPLEPTCK